MLQGFDAGIDAKSIVHNLAYSHSSNATTLELAPSAFRGVDVVSTSWTALVAIRRCCCDSYDKRQP